jgi:hypothetical protein
MFDKDRRVVEARVDRYSKARKEKHSIEDEDDFAFAENCV